MFEVSRRSVYNLAAVRIQASEMFGSSVVPEGAQHAGEHRSSWLGIWSRRKDNSSSVDAAREYRLSKGWDLHFEEDVTEENYAAELRKSANRTCLIATRTSFRFVSTVLSLVTIKDMVLREPIQMLDLEKSWRALCLLGYTLVLRICALFMSPRKSELFLCWVQVSIQSWMMLGTNQLRLLHYEFLEEDKLSAADTEWLRTDPHLRIAARDYHTMVVIFFIMCYFFSLSCVRSKFTRMFI